jgi:hypothetical protein
VDTKEIILIIKLMEKLLSGQVVRSGLALKYRKWVKMVRR